MNEGMKGKLVKILILIKEYNNSSNYKKYGNMNKILKRLFIL